jgi:hypothetical protein
MHTLEAAGTLLIVLGTLPLAAVVARVALKGLMSAMSKGGI